MPREIRADKLPAIPKATLSYGIATENLLFISGQVAIDPKTNKYTQGTIEEQTKLTLQNVKVVIEAAGASMSDIVKVGAIITKREHFAAFDATYRTFFEPPYPARTTIVALLAEPKVLVEVEAIVELKKD